MADGFAAMRAAMIAKGKARGGKAKRSHPVKFEDGSKADMSDREYAAMKASNKKTMHTGKKVQ